MANEPSALQRLQARLAQSRAEAAPDAHALSLTKRTPAPYPEGEVIYNCNKRFVVKHGMYITKYSTLASGFGAEACCNEAKAMQFVKKHTTIPVPAVISYDWDRITMEYVEGDTLKEAWPRLTALQQERVLEKLKDYLSQMRAIKGSRIQRLNGESVVVPSIFTRSGGPFTTVADFHHWLVRPPKRLQAQSLFWHEITAQLGSKEYPIQFTHGDIAARNIIVRDGSIVAIIDWEFAGWYPSYWEYVFAVRGLDNIDWDTLGSNLHALFDQRYGMEYILTSFILSLS